MKTYQELTGIEFTGTMYEVELLQVNNDGDITWSSSPNESSYFESYDEALEEAMSQQKEQWLHDRGSYVQEVVVNEVEFVEGNLNGADEIKSLKVKDYPESEVE